MFFVVVGTHTKCIINEFALDVRIDILIFQCHTVTNGIDLRRSPQYIRKNWNTRPLEFFSTAILKFSVSEGPSLEEIDMHAR